MPTLSQLRNKYNYDDDDYDFEGENYGNIVGPAYNYFCYFYSITLNEVAPSDIDNILIKSIMDETENQSMDGKFIVNLSLSELADYPETIDKLINTIKNYPFKEGESASIATIIRKKRFGDTYKCHLIQLSNCIGERHVIC